VNDAVAVPPDRTPSDHPRLHDRYRRDDDVTFTVVALDDTTIWLGHETDRVSTRIARTRDELRAQFRRLGPDGLPVGPVADLLDPTADAGSDEAALTTPVTYVYVGSVDGVPVLAFADHAAAVRWFDAQPNRTLTWLRLDRAILDEPSC
jgi:hypothetical protein